MTKRHTGQAVIEGVIAFMAFALILFATLDYGRSYLRWQALQNAVTEGAAYASKHGGRATPLMNDANKDALVTYVKNAAWSLDPANPHFSVTPTWVLADPKTGEPTAIPDPAALVGNFVTISATYPMDLNPYVQQYFTMSGCQRSLNFSATSTMRIIAQP